MPSLAISKRHAWDAFSIYIRTRDAIKTTGTLTHLYCVTCKKLYPAFGKGCVQAGHFIQGRHASVLMDERNCHGQCYNCNIRLKSNPTAYWLFMEREYGRAVIDELIALDKLTVQVKAWEYEERAVLYKQRVKDMIKEYEEKRTNH